MSGKVKDLIGAAGGTDDHPQIVILTDPSDFRTYQLFFAYLRQQGANMSSPAARRAAEQIWDSRLQRQE